MKRIIRYTLLLCAMALIAATGATAGSLITGAKVKDGSLTGKDVKNQSLTAKDFAGSRSAQGRDGRDGVAGANGTNGVGTSGPGGTPGPAGEDGKDGIAGVQGVKGDAGATGAQGEAGPSGAGSQAHWAEVTGAGTLSGDQKDVDSAAQISQGQYRVTFTASVSNCLPMAQAFEAGHSAYSSILDAHTVGVFPQDLGGAGANTGFRLLVTC